MLVEKPFDTGEVVLNYAEGQDNIGLAGLEL